MTAPPWCRSPMTGPRWRHLYDPELRAGFVVRVDPPSQAPVEAQGTVDFSHRDDDDLEAHIDGRIFYGVPCTVLMCLWRTHIDLP